MPFGKADAKGYGTNDLQRLQNTQERDEVGDWVNTVLAGAPSASRGRSEFEVESQHVRVPPPQQANGCSACMRVTLLVINGAAIFVSVGILCFAVLCLIFDDIGDKACSQCRGFFLVQVGTSLLIIVIATCGLVGASGSSCCLVVYNMLLVPVAIAVLFHITTVILIRERTYDYVEFLWKKSVKLDKHFMCSVQHQLECSGWDFQCGTGSGSGCPSDCVYNDLYDTVCQDKLHSWVSDQLVWLILSAVGALFIIIICWIGSCCVRQRRRTLDYTTL
ncbi:hypothetical protein DIPPA_06180 [Diplonema papillatum]|nr:hypothetical protein DIPPA_06180 [Diplonema papillatum]